MAKDTNTGSVLHPISLRRLADGAEQVLVPALVLLGAGETLELVFTVALP